MMLFNQYCQSEKEESLQASPAQIMQSLLQCLPAMGWHNIEVIGYGLTARSLEADGGCSSLIVTCVPFTESMTRLLVTICAVDVRSVDTKVACILARMSEAHRCQRAVS